MKTTPTLSIIIVSYNNRDLLDQCLRSIVVETPGVPLEIIVVDNASKDDTLSFLKKQYPKVTVIANPDNKGFAAANNQGLRLAKGDVLLLLNNDTMIRDRALIKMMDYLNAHPEIGLIGPKLLNANGTIQAQGSLLGPHFWNKTTPTAVPFLRGAVLMFPRKAMDIVGLLDEGFFFYNEDIDYAWRMRKSGYRVVYFPEADVVHIGGKSSLKKQWLGLQGTLYLWKKQVKNMFKNKEVFR